MIVDGNSATIIRYSNLYLSPEQRTTLVIDLWIRVNVVYLSLPIVVRDGGCIFAVQLKEHLKVK